MIEMLRIDIRDHRDGREQQQERRVALVGLGHHEIAAAETDVGAGVANISADRDGGIEVRLFHDERDQAGRGRLAVSSGDRDAELGHPQQLAEHLGSRDHRDFHFAGTRDFGIGKLYRRRDHYRVDAAVVLQMRRMMPLADFRAELREPRDS